MHLLSSLSWRFLSGRIETEESFALFTSIQLGLESELDSRPPTLTKPSGGVGAVWWGNYLHQLMGLCKVSEHHQSTAAPHRLVFREDLKLTLKGSGCIFTHKQRTLQGKYLSHRTLRGKKLRITRNVREMDRKQRALVNGPQGLDFRCGRVTSPLCSAPAVRDVAESGGGGAEKRAESLDHGQI